MKRSFCLAAGLVALLFTIQVHGQSAILDFQDGTDQGFGLKFSNDASANFPIVNVGGSLRMYLARTGAFQEADNSHGNDGSALYNAMAAAAANPAGYTISYDYYID